MMSLQTTGWRLTRDRIGERDERLGSAFALAIGGDFGSKLGFLRHNATSRMRLRGVTPRNFASQAARPNAGRSLELSRAAILTFTAGDRTRTGNVQLGRPTGQGCNDLSAQDFTTGDIGACTVACTSEPENLIAEGADGPTGAGADRAADAEAAGGSGADRLAAIACLIAELPPAERAALGRLIAGDGTAGA